jgi:tRNA uridine 5-carboxymethylaminomethyl modification enzyme
LLSLSFPSLEWFYKIGLASEDRYRRYLKNKEAVEKELERLKSIYVTPSEVKDFLERHGSAPLQNKISLAELMKRPEMTYEKIKAIIFLFPT